MPVLFGTAGEPVLDIATLYAKAKVFTHDPGFSATSSCESRITFIDGDAGVLLHGGYSIEDLAEKSDFIDVSYLVMFGELPSHAQRSEHISIIRSHTMVHEKVRLFYNGFEASSHPMAIMIGVVGSMSAFYHDELNVYNKQDQLKAAYRLVSKAPSLSFSSSSSPMSFRLCCLWPSCVEDADNRSDGIQGTFVHPLSR